jgi:hypothetical protein
MGQISVEIYEPAGSVLSGNQQAMLRKIGERTVSGLWNRIGSLVDIFKPAECANYFTACGYDPD